MSTQPTPTGPDQSDASVIARENLSLDLIDGQSHLVTSRFEVVQATCFAARAGHSSTTVFRFLTTLALTDNMDRPGMWSHVLSAVWLLEETARRNTERTTP